MQVLATAAQGYHNPSHGRHPVKGAITDVSMEIVLHRKRSHATAINCSHPLPSPSSTEAKAEELGKLWEGLEQRQLRLGLSGPIESQETMTHPHPPSLSSSPQDQPTVIWLSSLQVFTLWFTRRLAVGNTI